MNECRFFCANGGEGSVSEIFFVANGGNQSWQVWVSLRGKTKMAESRLAKFKMAEFKMATPINLSQNEWVKFFCGNGGKGGVSEIFLWQMVETNLGKCEWIWEEKLRWLNPRWENSRWQNSRWLPSSNWVRMNEFESDWISLNQSQSGVRVFLSESERRKQGVWIQDGRIQDGCHHQVESEWMSEVFFCANGGEGSVSEVFFVQMVGTNPGKCE